jgi:hypothetical protein
MIYLGQVLQLAERGTYHKIVVGVECGYHVDCYTVRITKDKMIGLSVGDKIGFTGYSLVRDDITQFHAESLIKLNFTSCEICCLPLTSNSCLMRHDREAQKLVGRWEVVHKIQTIDSIKLFFEQGHFVFAGVSTNDRWFHPTFQNLKKGDFVTINAWRYQRHTSFKVVCKNNI